MDRREGVPGLVACGARGPEAARGVDAAVSLPEAAPGAGVTGSRAATPGRGRGRHGR